MVLDIIIIALIALGAFRGYKKGLIGILFSIIGMAAAIILAFILQTAVAKSLYNTGIGESIRTTVSTELTKSIEEKIKDNSNEDDKINFYGIIVDTLAGEEQIESVSEKVTMAILKGISFVLVFFIVMLISYILQMILNVVFNLPILNSVNNIGGIIGGILKVVVKIYVVLAIVYFISATSFLQPVTNIIDNSILTKVLYNNNIFVNIITGGLNK